VISASQLQGTTAGGTFRVAESAVNDLLSRTRQATAPTIHFEPGNHALIRYGIFHARVRLPAAMEVGVHPRLTVTLASTVVAWGLKAVLTHPYVSVNGRHVTLDLSAIPALRSWQDWLRCFTSIAFSTTEAALAVAFTFQVPE
jgi:hypothetical protein